MYTSNVGSRFFVYLRRSQNSEDRQVCSIEDQRKELTKIAQQAGITIVSVFSESRSAKEPGRPEFNKMVEDLYAGKADGILVWKLNRLSRNPIDAGTVQWLLQKEIVQCIRTTTGAHYPWDNMIPLAVELGMTTQYILDLKVDIARGTRQKALRGWYPASQLPIGYQHTRSDERTTENEIGPHPIYFPIMKNLWKMLLTGKYSIAYLHRESIKLGLRNRTGGYLTVSGLHYIFSNEFYCGYFSWDVDGNKQKKRIKGRHKPMVTEAQFYYAQELCTKNTRPGVRQENDRFVFSGTLLCGECEGMVGPDRKIQVRCTNAECRHRFSCKHRISCPKCELLIADMQEPKIMDYTYYHCSKKKGPCSQKTIRADILEEQFLQKLSEIQFTKEFAVWAKIVLSDFSKEEQGEKALLSQKWQSRNTKLQNTLANYDRMFAMGDISRERYESFKEEIQNELKEHHKQNSLESHCQDNWYDFTAETIDLATDACRAYKKASIERRKSMFKDLGANQRIVAKTLCFTMVPTFAPLKKLEEFAYDESNWSEPGLSSKSVENKRLFKGKMVKSSLNEVMWTRLSEVRTTALKWIAILKK